MNEKAGSIVCVYYWRCEGRGGGGGGGGGGWGGGGVGRE